MAGLTKLEQEVERQEQRDAQNARRATAAKAKAEKIAWTAKVKGFKRDFLTVFPKLLTLVDVRFREDKAVFDYKGETYYIAYDYWESKGFGSDGCDMDGHHYVLHRYAGYTKTYSSHTKVLVSYPKDKQDYTNEVVSGLREFVKKDQER